MGEKEVKKKDTNCGKQGGRKTARGLRNNQPENGWGPQQKKRARTKKQSMNQVNDRTGTPESQRFLRSNKSRQSHKKKKILKLVHFSSKGRSQGRTHTTLNRYREKRRLTAHPDSLTLSRSPRDRQYHEGLGGRIQASA